MHNFNLGALDKWRQVGIGEILALDIPAAGYRSVAFDIIATGTVSCNAVAGDDYWLVAHGEGAMAVKFTTDKAVGLVFVGDPSTDVFLRTHVEAPVIPESREASYTTIEPRPAGPSEDVKRMMYIMRLNEQRRQQQMHEEMARLRAEFPKQTLEERKAEKAAQQAEPAVIEDKADE